MDRYRDFDAALAEQGDPLRFRLGGVEFTCLPEIPAGPMLKLARHADQIDADALRLFGEFLAAIIVPEQREDFDRALDRVGLGTLLELIQWVVEEAIGRPLPNASSSEQEQPQDGAPSRVVSLVPIEGAL